MNKYLQLITDFLAFAKKYLNLGDLDAIYCANQLYEEFKVYPDRNRYTAKDHDVDYFVKQFNDFYKDDINQASKVAHLFDIVSPRPSLVEKKFNELKQVDIRLATSYLYNLGINNYYIHKSDIDKNEEWTANFKSGPSLDITINLSKPEKNNKDIAKLLLNKEETNYPKCVICLENLGFYGNAKRAPRQNIRVIPMTLNNERWFMQYSPYGYFKEHMILVDYKHEPMEISPRIFKLLFAFNHQVPHYTIVSNSDLPIVGGSILNHEHFQGGYEIFPIQKAQDLTVLKSKKYTKTKISILDFYNTAIKLTGKSEEEIIKIASLILSKWRNYVDNDLSICKKHNTVTPILRFNPMQQYELILILRNNMTSKEYPDGIYHVHPQYFAIKQEGIGVIEASGRFILPARLKRQIREVEDVIKHHLDKKTYLKKYPDLDKFDDMIKTLKAHPKMNARDYINDVCKNILDNTSVFKKNKEGFAHFNRFLKTLDL